MSQDYSIKPTYIKNVLNLIAPEFGNLIQSADVFICAAGFEARAERVPLAANVARNPIIITYKNGPAENDITFNKFASKFEKVPGFDVCEIDFADVEKFETAFENSLRKLQNMQSGNIVLDISALPNFAICIVVMKIRRILPTANLTLLYTEAEKYFPQKKDLERIKRLIKKENTDLLPEYMSGRAANIFMPTMFSGIALGQYDTCLIIFAGYEPYRTNCVIEATNPNKLVMVYGEPERPDLKWRLQLSQIMHRNIDRQLLKTEEHTSTSKIDDNLELLLEYYKYLYDDHVLCVCPTNSKMQAVASALAWEIYPDIQLTFSIPAEYLPKSFSLKWRDTFAIDLGLPPLAQRFMHKQKILLGE